jgi:hypothetical protein
VIAQTDRQHTSSAASEDLREISPDTLACQLSTQRTNAKTMAKRWRDRSGFMAAIDAT